MEKCKCYCLPMEGRFVVGNMYTWSYIIDGIQVTDESNQEIYFDEIKFLWFFQKISAVADKG